MTRGLGLRFALLTGMAIGLVALSAVIQELQAASTAWIAGQGYWSRGQQDATAALSRYLARGHLQDLQDAQTALQVPLGDLQARKAIEESAAARRNEVWLPWADESAPVADPHDLPPFEGGWRHVKANNPVTTRPADPS
jgi:hypothetical protein